VPKHQSAATQAPIKPFLYYWHQSNQGLI